MMVVIEGQRSGGERWPCVTLTMELANVEKGLISNLHTSMPLLRPVLVKEAEQMALR